MQTDFLASLMAELEPEAQPVRVAPTGTIHPHATITATDRGVLIVAPEQSVAEYEFQPVAERPVLPAVRHQYSWTGIRRLFRLWEGCEPLGLHPLAPWIERIMAAVAATEHVRLDIEPWCVSFTRIVCRSLWTGIEREDLLHHAESASCDDHQHALARADAVAARLRARGRFVVIRDNTPDDQPEAAPRYEGPTKEMRIGNLVITMPVEVRP